MGKFEKVIKGNIILENTEIAGAIGINNGKIEKISSGNEQLEGKETIDFGNSYIFPGAIDVHVHCFSNPEEGFERTSTLAAAGGITTFLDMPYDRPNPINNVENLKKKVELLEKEAVVDIGLWGTIAKRNGTDQIVPLAEAGVMAFKMSTYETDEYRFPRIPDNEILKAMQILKDIDILVAFHSENDEIISSLINEFTEENKVYPKAHTETRPPVSETSAVLKLMEFAYWTKAKLHIVHVSHPRTLELIKRFRTEGTNVTAETCYTYLLLDIENLDEYGPIAKMNPPLRDAKDVENMWKHLEEGNIDLISSDHVAWSKESKEAGNDDIFKAAAGLPGLEVIVPLMFNSMVSERGLSPVQFAQLMSTKPAEIFEIHGKGKIKEGYDADFVVIDPKKEWKLGEGNLYTDSNMLPFSNTNLQGKVVQTIVRGNTVFDGEKVVAKPGDGKFLKGSAAK